MAWSSSMPAAAGAFWPSAPGTGAPAWSIVTGTRSYTSPHLATLAGQRQVLFLSDAGLISVEPSSGGTLVAAAERIGAPQAIQPHPLSDTTLLVSSETDLGTAEVSIARHGDDWEARRTWTSRALKPSFDDFVVDDGYIYGFDGTVFCCVDLQGKKHWREGRYDHGQVLLLADSHLLLVTSEQGDDPAAPRRPATRRSAGSRRWKGKPGVIPRSRRGKLYVRSDQELACFDITAQRDPR